MHCILKSSGYAHFLRVFYETQGFPLEPSAMVPPAEVCVHCKGTHLSGPFYQCDECSEFSVHWHCFRELGLEPLEGRWICDSCCLVCWNFSPNRTKAQYLPNKCFSLALSCIVSHVYSIVSIVYLCFLLSFILAVQCEARHRPAVWVVRYDDRWFDHDSIETSETAISRLS